MSKSYAFTANEFLPVHTRLIDSLQADLEECQAALAFVCDHPSTQDVVGLCPLIEMLQCQLDAIIADLQPEALTRRPEGVNVEVRNVE